MDTIGRYNRKYSLTGWILLLVLFLPPIVLLIYNGYGAVPALFTDMAFLRQTGLFLARACACTLAALVVSIPGIVIYSGCRPAFRKLLRVLLSFGFCFPPVLMGMGFDSLFGTGGFIADLALDPVLRSAAISLMLNIPLFIVMVGEHCMTMDISRGQCALSLGASGARIFFSITLPKVMPALIGTAALVLLRNMAGMENEIISLLLSLPVLAVLNVCDRKRNATGLSAGLSDARFGMGNAFTVILSFIYMTAAAALLLGPAVALALRSVLTESGLSFSVYTNLDWMGLAISAAASVAAAVISSYISFHISVGIASSDSGTFPVLLPFAAGPAVLAAGFGVLYQWLPQTMVIRMVLTVICFILLFVPIQTMIMLHAVRRVPMTLRGTSLSLGFTNGSSLRNIDLRLVAVHIRSALFTTIAVGLCSYGVAESLGLDTVFAQALRSYEKGDVRTACAVGTVILILGFILFAAGIGHTREVKRYV